MRIEARFRIVALLFGTLAALSVFSAFYNNVRTGRNLSLIFTVVVSALAIGLLFASRYRIGNTVDHFLRLFDRVSEVALLWCVCLIGSLLRIGWSLWFVPEQASDGLIYLTLAQQLLSTGVYAMDGTRAYWPPGYPFFLLPFMSLLGNGTYVPLAANVILFNATVLFTFGLARAILGQRLARLPVMLIAVWPSLIMGSGTANKEYLVGCLVVASAYCYVAGTNSDVPLRRALLAGLSGVLLGGAGLAQPSVLVLGLAYPLWELLRESSRLGSAIPRIAAVVLGGVLIISPWTVRNYLVLHAFVPVATHGPVNFWSANNEGATGGWIRADYDRFLKDEMAGGRQALSEALLWIKENPKGFMILTVKRIARFLGSDEGIAFGPPRPSYPEDSQVVVLGKLVANVFWFFIIGLLSAGAFLRLEFDNPAALQSALPIFMVLLLLAVHSIFQSEDRHHVNVTSMLAILASVCAGHIPEAANRLGGRKSKRQSEAVLTLRV